jgi:hypothetical protein
MLGIIGVIAFLTVLTLSLVITRIATVALTMTGLSSEAAEFQARSAFTGTGFTTSEAEKIVNHPVRRRIVTLLMIARSAGLVTILISVMLSFASLESDSQRLWRLVWLTGGVFLLWVVSRRAFFRRHLSRMIEWALQKWTSLDTRDYESLLKLSGQYTVNEFQVTRGGWLADKTLKDCRLFDEGVLILGIYRSDGSYIGAPKGRTQIYAGDTLILYGRQETLRELNQRRNNAQGNMAHDRAVSKQKSQEEQEEIQDIEKRRE